MTTLLSDKEFTDRFCSKCGSQRCEGIGTEWFDGCAHAFHLESYYTSREKENKEKGSVDPIHLINNIAKMCIEKGGFNVDIHSTKDELSIGFYPWGE